MRVKISVLARAVVLASTIFAAQSQAQTYSVLYSFTGGADGGVPDAALIRDQANNLYGTTSNRGNLNDCGTAGCGTVFQLDTTGKLTVLHSFTGQRDGAFPVGALVSDARGDLYGTTTSGGGATCPSFGCGTVFKLNTTGNYRVLYHFSGSDGKYPESGVILDAAGNLYGTTAAGGDLTCASGNGCGTVFQLDANGTLTLLHSFSGADGLYPYAVLVRDAVGNLYGTTFGGGAYGFGTVFKLDTTGTLTVLYSFSNSPDGSGPNAGLIRDVSGNLYGTTYYGGIDTCSPLGCGTVFKVDANGNETVLYSFTGGLDGSNPFAGLLQDAAGNLYGTTSNGGDVHCLNPSGGCGTVFRLDPVTGGFRTLHRFAGGTDGALSYAGLISDGTGNLVGTTQAGGAYGYGTVFRISPR
jgi:uncharacterized repeat protein (TIGR03803 family)